MQVKNVRVSQVKQVGNSRITKVDHEMANLMKSIKKDGLLQPIGVAKKGTKYNVVYGNRRFEACKKLGHKTVSAVILPEGTTEKDAMILNFTENEHREDLTTHDMGVFVRDLKNKFNMTPSEIAARLSVNRGRVQNILKCSSSIPAEFRDKVRLMGSGKKKKGTIPEQYLPTLVSITGKHHMTKPQTKKLYEYCTRDTTTKTKLEKVGVGLKDGLSLPAAIKAAGNIENVRLNIVVESGVSEALAKKYKMSINKVLEAKLFDELNFKLKRLS